jgi:hypothetical protein
MLRRSLLVAAMLLVPAALAAAPATLAAASVPASHAPTCSGVIQITRLAFTPPAVTPGGTSTANLAARNCTGTSQQTTAVWLGRFVGSGTGIPPGCPAIDPLAESVAFAPHGQFRSGVSYLVPATCTATQLQVTVELEQGGTVLAEATADLTIIIQPTAASQRQPI